MGNAKRRGDYATRVGQAIAAGRVKVAPEPKPDKATAQILINPIAMLAALQRKPQRRGDR